jgi:hypothetical protein
VVEHKLKYLTQILSYNYNKKEQLKCKCLFQVGGIVELYKKDGVQALSSTKIMPCISWRKTT